MSKYNKSILTDAGMDLAKRANAGKAKFSITRTAATSDDLSKKSNEELQKLAALPNIVQWGKIQDAEGVESDNTILGVSLRYDNQDLKKGYNINAVGLYVKEEGKDTDFLYALTTAEQPEYMPDFSDQVLYRFNLQMYLVVGRAATVNVLVDDDTAISTGKFNKYKAEADKTYATKIEAASAIAKPFPEDLDSLQDLPIGKFVNPNVRYGDADHTGISGMPQDTTGAPIQIYKLNDNFYIILTTLGEICFGFPDNWIVSRRKFTNFKVMTPMPNDPEFPYQTRMDQIDSAEIYGNDQVISEFGLLDEDSLNLIVKKLNFNGNNISDLQKKAKDFVTTQAAQSMIEAHKPDLSGITDDINKVKADKADRASTYTKTDVDSKTSGTVVTGYDISSKKATTKTVSYNSAWLVDQTALIPFADAINQLKGRHVTQSNSVNVDTLTESGIYTCTNSGNTGTPSFFNDKRGTLITLSFDRNAKTQLWFPVGTEGRTNTWAIRYWEGKTAPEWKKEINSDDVQNEVNAGIQKLLNGQHTSIANGYDLNNLHSNIVYASGFTPKNAPSGVSQWTYYLAIGNNPTTQFAIEATASAKIWIRTFSGAPASWSAWILISNTTTYTNSDIDGKLNNKADKSNTYTKSEVDSKTSGTVVTSYNVERGTAGTAKANYNDKQLVDVNALNDVNKIIKDIMGNLGSVYQEFSNKITQTNQNVTNLTNTVNDGLVHVFDTDAQAMAASKQHPNWICASKEG